MEERITTSGVAEKKGEFLVAKRLPGGASFREMGVCRRQEPLGRKRSGYLEKRVDGGAEPGSGSKRTLVGYGVHL